MINFGGENKSTLFVEAQKVVKLIELKVKFLIKTTIRFYCERLELRRFTTVEGKQWNGFADRQLLLTFDLVQKSDLDPWISSLRTPEIRDRILKHLLIFNKNASLFPSYWLLELQSFPFFTGSSSRYLRLLFFQLFWGANFQNNGLALRWWIQATVFVLGRTSHKREFRARTNKRLVTSDTPRACRGSTGSRAGLTPLP